MPLRRSYAEHGDACAAAHAFDVVGDRWAIIVIRELTLGPKRFNELLAGAPGATPTVLTTRLRELEHARVVDRVELPPPARVPVYQLTAWGRAFEPILQAMGRWAQLSPSIPRHGGLTPDAAILAMRTMADGPNPRTRLAFDLSLRDDRAPRRTQSWYRVLWGPGPLVAEKYTEDFAATDTIECDSTVWTGLLFDDQNTDAILTSTDVSARGAGRRLAKRFLSHFHQGLPAPTA